MIDYDKSMYSEEEFGEAPTLRDQFAIAAMRGSMFTRDVGSTHKSDQFASWCYQMADAMMEARNK